MKINLINGGAGTELEGDTDEIAREVKAIARPSDTETTGNETKRASEHKKMRLYLHRPRRTMESA